MQRRLVAPKADAKAFYGGVGRPRCAGLGECDGRPRRHRAGARRRGDRVVTVVSIPPTLQVSLKTARAYPLREASTQEGDAALASAVADSQGERGSLREDRRRIHRAPRGRPRRRRGERGRGGGRPERGRCLPAGTRRSTAQALTFCAPATSNGLEVQAANQRELLTALSLRLLGEGRLSFATPTTHEGRSVETDLSAAAALRRRCTSR